MSYTQTNLYTNKQPYIKSAILLTVSIAVAALSGSVKAANAQSNMTGANAAKTKEMTISPGAPALLSLKKEPC